MEQPLPAERHRKVRELLQQRRAVRVSSLSDLFGVSEVTIRRDLEELEGRGLLERTHGGAILAQRLWLEPPYDEAANSNTREKGLIGAAAAALVQPGDTVFLNGGTTTLEVFRRIEVRGVRVVTNHIGVANADHARGELLVVGGEYRPPSNSCVGAFATEALRKVFATRAIIGVEGLSRRSGLTTPAAPEAEIARVMIEQTQGEVVVVADHTKVGTVADFAIAPLEAATMLVTDDGLGGEFRQELEELGVEVLVAGSLASVGGTSEHG